MTGVVGEQLGLEMAEVGLDVPVGYKRTEVGVIPEDWGVSSLEELIVYRNGAAHESCVDSNGSYTLVNSKFISTQGAVRKNSSECRQPAYYADVLMVMSDVPNGRAIAKCYWVEADDTYTVNQRICALKSVDVDSRYLFYKLNRNPFYLAFDDGAKQTNLRRQDVLDCPLPLPPKPEQTAIATALSNVDALITELQTLIAKKQAIKTATMQQLLTGRTRLPQFALREDGTPKGYKASELGEIPEDWETNLLGSVCSSFKTGKLDANAMRTDGEYRFYTCAREYYFIDKYAFDTEALLISGNGANVGYVHYFKGKFNAYQRTYVLSDFSADVIYLKIYLERKLAERIRVEVNSGNTPYITMDTLTDMSIVLPPVKEQTAIANILSDMDSDISNLQQRLSKAQQIKQGMMQQLLTGKIRLITPAYQEQVSHAH